MNSNEIIMYLFGIIFFFISYSIIILISFKIKINKLQKLLNNVKVYKKNI